MIELVFFDAGDTLLRPHPSFEELFASVCSARGHEITPADVTAVRERMAPHLVDIAEATGVDNPSLSAEASLTFWSFLYRRFLEELRVDDEGLVKELFSVFSSSASYKLYPDVLPAVEDLRASGYRLGLISNFETWLEDMLVELELGGVFEPVVISGREGIEKPDPALYRIAVERSGIDPSRGVHVGDSPKMDVEPALEVGLNAVLLDRLDRYPDVAYPRIASLSELIPTIGRL